MYHCSDNNTMIIVSRNTICIGGYIMGCTLIYDLKLQFNFVNFSLSIILCYYYYFIFFLLYVVEFNNNIISYKFVFYSSFETYFNMFLKDILVISAYKYNIT